MLDPQSLHKYVYAHGDPVQGVDPTGLSLTASTMSGSAIGAQLNSMQGNSSLKVLEMVTAVAAGASAGQALLAAVAIDTVLFGLPIAGPAIMSFAKAFLRSTPKFVSKLPVATISGSLRVIMPGIGQIQKTDRLAVIAFHSSRALNSGSSNALRRQLELANDLPIGSLVRQGIEAHHVIPKELKENALLRQLNFNIDSALNGIPLSNVYHRGSHPNYNAAWNRVLDTIERSGASLKQKEEYLLAALANANKAILDGPGLRMTSSEANNFGFFRDFSG